MEPTQSEGQNWIYIIKDGISSIWGVIGLLVTGGGIVQILQFIRAKQKDKADTKLAEVNAESASVELMDKTMERVDKAFNMVEKRLERERLEMEKKYDELKTELDESVKRERQHQKRVIELEKREKQYKKRIEELEKTVRKLMAELHQLREREQIVALGGNPKKSEQQ